MMQCKYNQLMAYEWDETKRQSNIDKHGLDFVAANAFDWNSAMIIEDLRQDEERFIAYGYIEQRLVCIVFTVRDENIRIISMRKANKREVKKYA